MRLKAILPRFGSTSPAGNANMCGFLFGYVERKALVNAFRMGREPPEIVASFATQQSSSPA